MRKYELKSLFLYCSVEIYSFINYHFLGTPQCLTDNKFCSPRVSRLRHFSLQQQLITINRVV